MRRGRIGHIAILALALFVALTGIAANGVAMAQSGGRIGGVEVRGNERIESATVESYLTLTTGDAFDTAKQDESLKALFATGLFEDVTILREGDRLIVTVKENPIINRIAFEGNKRIEDKTLEQEVQLRERVVYTRAKVQSAVTRILELYRRSGRFAATVDPKVIQLDQNRVDLVFEISEGPLTNVGGVNFVGNEVFSDRTLRGVIQTKEAAWWRFLSSDDTYDPDRLNFDEELLRRFYLSRGYADFNVRSAIAELSPDGEKFFITITIEEGAEYKVGEVTVDSRIKDLNSDELTSLVQNKVGDVFNGDEVEATVQSITDKLGELGYAFVKVDPQIQPDRENHTLNIQYVVQEGPRVYVERIDITGNVRTLDSVIRREFRLAEGDAFNTALLRRSQQRLRNLGFFEKVDIQTEQGSAPDRVVIKTSVVEKSTGELSFGVGYSTSDGPLGDVRLKERNLLGKGQDLTLNFTVSAIRQNAVLSFTEPYFLERDLSAGFDLFSTRTDQQSQSSYDQRSFGGTLRMGYPLTENLRHSVRYTLRNDEIYNVDDDASIFIKDEEGTTLLTSLVGQTFTFDRRDEKFLPNNGYYLRLDNDIAGLGGNNNYFSFEGRSEYYYTVVPNVVANVSGAFGYIQGITDEVHIENRYFIGGNTLRGFKYAGIGPRDSETDDALGGNLYYVASTELRFPLGLPKELAIFGRTFVDVGTLTEIDVSGPTLLDSGSLRGAAGVGMSWLSPFGPLTIDVSYPFMKEDYDQTETLRVSFGTRF